MQDFSWCSLRYYTKFHVNLSTYIYMRVLCTSRYLSVLFNNDVNCWATIASGIEEWINLELLWCDTDRRKLNEENSVPVPLIFLQIPHGLAIDWTRISTWEPGDKSDVHCYNKNFWVAAYMYFVVILNHVIYRCQIYTPLEYTITWEALSYVRCL